MMSRVTKYNLFHKDANIQKRIVDFNNFTYGNLLVLISQYVSSNSKILDLGCGVGTIDFYLSNKCNYITCVDYSDKAIKIAKVNAELLGVSKNLFFLQKKFPEQIIPGKYDIVLCIEFLEHIRDDKLALANIKNLLRKNGVVIFSVPSINSPLYKLRLAKQHDERVGHLRRYSVETLKTLIKMSNLKIIKIERKESVLRNLLFSFSIFNIIIKIANRFSILSKILTYIDNMLSIFGEGQIIIVAKKV